MNLIERTWKLIKLGTIGDIKDINELLVDLVAQYTEYDTQSAIAETWYETYRAKIYLESKAKKKKWESKMSDKDIDNYAKSEALKKYWDYKERLANKRTYKMYIDLLVSKKVEIFTMDKRQSTI